jgi:hypothetical protein
MPIKKRWKERDNLALVISVLSLTLTCVSFWSTRQNERMFKKAHLKVRGGRVLQYTNRDRQVSFEVVLENTGETPAYIDSNALRLFVVEKPYDLPVPVPGDAFQIKPDDIGRHGHSLEVTPKGTAVLTTLLCFCLSPYREQEEVGLLGHLSYRDGFGESHYENWGWIILDLETAYVPDDLPDDDVGAFRTDREAIDDETVQAIFRSMNLSSAR